MNRQTYLAMIAIVALGVGLLVLFGPKSRQPNESTVALNPIPSTIKKKSEQRPPAVTDGDIQQDIELFRQCNSGQTAACRELANSRRGGRLSTRHKKQLSNITPAAAHGQPLPKPPIIFNKLMVKTAVDFARRKLQCSKKSCPQPIDPQSEPARIYLKILQEAYSGCNRRQAEACEIQGDILAAEGQYKSAFQSMTKGLQLTKSTMSLCNQGVETAAIRCQEGRERFQVLQSKSQAVQKSMFPSH